MSSVVPVPPGAGLQAPCSSQLIAAPMLTGVVFNSGRSWVGFRDSQSLQQAEQQALSGC